MTREQAVRALQSEYVQLQADNLAREHQRMAEATARDPQVGALLARREALLREGLDVALARPGQATAALDTLYPRMAEANRALRAALAALGLPEDYLEPRYRCETCRDTGVVGDPLRSWCPCFRQRLTEALYAEEGMAALRYENFDTFDAGIFPDEPLPGQALTQRAGMLRHRALCERYADAFPDTSARNLLLSGASGLGKSFLMNCVAQRVLSRGFTVARVTAPKLVTVMRRYHFNGEGAEEVAQWTDAQLLLLDDLGAEPMIENVTLVHLFGILNDRMTARRHTLISTNLTMVELVQAYTERMTSRLLDVHATQVLSFAGRDVRLLR